MRDSFLARTSAAHFLRDVYAIVKILRRHRSSDQNCPCCGGSGRFRIFGLPPRLNARCPHCGSLERHRLLRLYLDKNPDIISGKDILHFAPELSLRRLLAAKSRSYIACDMHPKEGDQKIDIEEIRLADDSFDLVICSHVLEHVNDRRALVELRRVLRKGGILIIMVPIIEGWDSTLEDPTVTDSDGRLRLFGQEDHVRYYGRDVRARITSSGFSLSEYTAEEPEVSKYALLRGEKVLVGS